MREGAPQPKDTFGRFLHGGDDTLLHFLEIKDSPKDLRPITLRFDRERMGFLPLIDEFPIEDFTYSKHVNGANGYTVD